MEDVGVVTEASLCVENVDEIDEPEEQESTCASHGN